GRFITWAKRLACGFVGTVHAEGRCRLRMYRDVVTHGGRSRAVQLARRGPTVQGHPVAGVALGPGTNHLTRFRVFAVDGAVAILVIAAIDLAARTRWTGHRARTSTIDLAIDDAGTGIAARTSRGTRLGISPRILDAAVNRIVFAVRAGNA